MGTSDLKNISVQKYFQSPGFPTHNLQATSLPTKSQAPTKIQIPSSEIIRLASAGSWISQNAWQKINPLWFSPLGIFSLAGCSNEGPCAGNQCNAPDDDPDSGTVSNNNNSHRPILEGLKDLQGEVGKKLTFQFIAIGSDGNSSSVHLQILPDDRFPENATLNRLSDRLWEFNWTPQQGQDGDFQVGIVVTSGLTQTSGMVKITILPKNLNDLCNSPTQGIHAGTLQDPYTFQVFVAMDEVTRMEIERLGWNIEDGIARQFSELNAGFNNGELAGAYNFIPMKIQYFTDWHNTPYPEMTEMDDVWDFQLIFNIHDGVTGHAGGRRIIMGVTRFFDPMNTDFKAFIHEFGHLLGAQDLYMMGISNQENDLFPGFGYSVTIPSYMQSGPAWQPIWDGMTAGILNATGGDLEKAWGCDNYWLRTWIPDNLSFDVVDDASKPISSAEIKIYRNDMFTGGRLDESDLWFTGSTNLSGQLMIPHGIGEETNSFYPFFLGAISYNGENYLKWFDITQLTIAYLEGQKNLVFQVPLDETTRYHIPKKTNLEISNLQVKQNIIEVGKTINLSFTITNHGPEAFAGSISHQISITPGEIEDGKGLSGRSQVIDLQPEESLTIERESLIRTDTAPGIYFILGSVVPSEEGYWDPDESNNTIASSPITVIQP